MVADLTHPANWKLYFDMPEPRFGLHLSYLEPGKVETIHVVH